MNKRILVLMCLLLFLPLVGCFPPPTNQAPILTSSPITTATVGVEYTYDVNATDPDEDTLIYSLSVKPTGMTINSKTGMINWAPTSTQIGKNSVTVKVSDGSLSITQSFTIKVSTFPVVNQAPVIYSTQITTATVGVIYVYDVNATDPDGDTLVYSLTTYPSNMAINSATGLIWWTPTSAQVGNNLVTVKAFDGVLDDTQSFTVKVSKPTPMPINHAPVITTTTLPVATVETEYTTTVVATDADGDALTFSLVSENELTGMVIGETTGEISGWTPTEIGTENVTVTVTDGENSVSTSFTIVVTVPTQPVYNSTQKEYYDTIEEALEEAEDYNTIEVAAGTYKPTDALNINEEAVTLKSVEGADKTIIDFTDKVVEPNACIYINASDVTVEGFTVKHSSTTEIVGIWTDVNNSTITGNILYFATITVADGNHSMISDNMFPDGGGINLENRGSGTNDVTITRNNISSANISLCNVPPNVVYHLDNIKITENTISKNPYVDGGIRIATNTTNLRITNNNITENENGGITVGYYYDHEVSITWDENNVIRYNNIEDNGGFGLKVYSSVTEGDVDAILNWWGAASGPSGGLADSVESEEIADGTGDAIVNASAVVGINFYPFSEVEN